MPAMIRPAGPHDASAIASAHVAAWRATYSQWLEPEFIDSITVERRTAQWQRALSDASPQNVFVAEEAGEIAGFASAGPSAHALAPFDCELYTLYLLPQAQGRGTGTRLLAACVERMIARGFSGMLVWVLGKNAPAITFYERLGAQYLKSAPNPVDDHADSVYGFNDLRALAALTATAQRR